MKKLVIIGMLMLSVWGASAQNSVDGAASPDSNVVVLDDIRFEAEQFVIDSTARAATVTLTLTSLKDKPRELNINVYGTQLVDNNQQAYYFSTITLGRVRVRFEDKQNYLHYLLQPDIPAKMTITTRAVSDLAETIQVVKIVFEDSAENGRFLEAYLTASIEPQN